MAPWINSMTATGVRLRRKPSEQEFEAWIALIYAHPWGRVTASRVATAEAIVGWARLLGADFIRPGQRTLAQIAGLPQKTVGRSIKSLIDAGFLEIDTPGDKAQLRAATYGLVFPRLQANPMPAHGPESWLGIPGLWNGNCYGRQAYRIAVEVDVAGDQGTTATAIASRLNLHRSTVRKYLREFHDDGFIRAPAKKHRVHALVLDADELTCRVQMVLKRRHAAAKREAQAARYQAERQSQRGKRREQWWVSARP